MGRLNPFFEVEGQTYEIVRTRAVECEYDKIRQRNEVDENEVRYATDYTKLVNEYAEILERYENARNEFFDDVLNEEKEKVYNAFKKLSDIKYQEVQEFELKNKDFSLEKLQDKAYKNGVELLVYALSTNKDYSLSAQQARNVWGKFEEHFGLDYAKNWITAMIRVLFESDEEEQDPFLKQANAKMLRKLEQRKGLSKVRK